MQATTVTDMEPRLELLASKLYNIIKGNISEVTMEELKNFLLPFNPEKRKVIINTHFTDFHEKTSVHLTAEMNKAPFLQILLENGGEYYNPLKSIQ